MAQSPPIQRLLDEHQVVTSVLEAVEAMAKRTGDVFEHDFYEKAFDFFQTFAHHNHFAKEQAYFFPLLESRGALKEGGAIGVWLHEHSDSWDYIAAAQAAIKQAGEGDPGMLKMFRRNTAAFVKLLQSHIAKENVFYITSELRMTPQDKEKLWQQFQTHEEKVLPPDKRETYLALARELRAQAGL